MDVVDLVVRGEEGEEVNGEMSEEKERMKAKKVPYWVRSCDINWEEVTSAVRSLWGMTYGMSQPTTRLLIMLSEDRAEKIDCHAASECVRWHSPSFNGLLQQVLDLSRHG